jgi:hypothetical protein
MFLTSVYAQVGKTVTNPLGQFTTLADVFGVAMNVIIGVAVSLAVIFLGLGGIKYITAQGDAKAAEEARTMLTNAIIGLVIALGALAIKTIVLDSILGVGDGDLPNGDLIIGEDGGSSEPEENDPFDPDPFVPY